MYITKLITMNLVYTAIYGGYDKLWQPKQINEGWEYRCYTDKPLDGKAWKIVGKRFPDIGNAKASKFIKIMQPMEDFDNILWIDGCVEIVGDLDEFVSKLPKGDLIVARHPFNNTLQQELDACIRMNKDDHKIMKDQVAGYKNFPPYIHTQNTVILKRGDLKASSIWWEEVKNGSKRDQLSFGWAMYKANQPYYTFPWELVEKYFVWHKLHDK